MSKSVSRSAIVGVGYSKILRDKGIDGRSVAVEGSLPLNTSGGQLAEGRLHGLGFLAEGVPQLRGDWLRAPVRVIGIDTV